MNDPLQSPLGSAGDLANSSSVHSLVSLAFVFGMLIYWTLAFFILYHLIRFGVGNQPKKIAVVFLAGSLILSIVTSLFLAQVIL